MSSFTSATAERLRQPGAEPRDRVRPQDAEVSVRPKFVWLAALALAAVVAQSTILRSISLGGAHLSLLTILLVWTGLRCGVTTGGILGFIAGLVEDGLGSGGANVLGTTLVGFGAGLLNTTFFSDSLPVFVAAVAGATIVRGIVTYLVMEIGLGERGMFHHYSHELLWQLLLNAVAAAVALLVSRVIAHARK